MLKRPHEAKTAVPWVHPYFFYSAVDKIVYYTNYSIRSLHSDSSSPWHIVNVALITLSVHHSKQSSFLSPHPQLMPWSWPGNLEMNKKGSWTKPAITNDSTQIIRDYE